MEDTLDLSMDRAEPLLRLIKESGLAEHSSAVGSLARHLGRWIGLSVETSERLYLAGALHDIGKLAVPEEIINKRGPLTEEEWILVRLHPETGWRYLRRVGLVEEAEWVLMHHERPDGRGYPNRLSAGRIPVEASILALADSYSAMTDDRLHQTAMSEADALVEVCRCSGSQFDPLVVQALLGMAESASRMNGGSA